MKKRISYIAGREATYSRTRTMIKALELAGYQLLCFLPPDKSFRHYPRLIWDFIFSGRSCDIVIVGFYGQLLLPIIRLFTKKPILFDVYISTYDTMVYDREKAKPGSLKARIYRFFDRMSMRLSDGILLETRDHILDYSRKFKIPINKFQHLFLAVDNSLIFPKNGLSKKGSFLVHFHGEYAPFHGVQYILQAANLLQEENVHFEIIGRGLTYHEDRDLAERLRLKNVRFIDWIPYEQLGESMARADCCLGIFGDNARTPMVLTNKVVETLAAAKPLISVKNKPVQELVKNGESALLVPPASPQAIANAILKLKRKASLKSKIAQAGYRVFLKHCTIQIFSDHLKNIVEAMGNA